MQMRVHTHAFIRFSLVPLVALGILMGAGRGTAGPERTWTLRVGRQELHYGAGRMIAAREGPNVRLGVDAVQGRYRSGSWRVDAFVARPLRVTRHTIGARVHGTAGSLRYDLEGAVQGGRYERRTAPAEDGVVRAWMLAGRLAYRFSDGLGHSAVGIQADLSSGDCVDTAANETFVAPYPSGRYTDAGS